MVIAVIAASMAGAEIVEVRNRRRKQPVVLKRKPPKKKLISTISLRQKR